MKSFFSKYFFVLCFNVLFISNTVYCQSVNNTFATEIDNIFQHLDKNRVPHGILTDYGLEYVDLTAYGSSLNSDNYTNRATIHESFYTLISSRIRQVNTGFMQPHDFEKNWNNHRSKGKITLGGLFFKYSKFLDNAYTSGKVNISNNKLYDVFNRGTWVNPYEEKNLFMIAPSINFYKGTSFQVKLPQDIFLSNYSNLIQSIEVDFQDGQGYRTISFNQTLNVSYSTANTYVWKFRLTLTTGQQLLSHSEVIIEEGLKTKAYGAPAQKISAQNIVQNTISDEFERQPITASKPFEGRFGTATLFIRDLGDDGIRNPLIIVEGFDTGGVLNPEQEGGDNNIEDFLESVENGTTNFELTVDGYDIIYVDWDNGVDFIQRNAYVLEEAIKWINDEKQSNGSSVKNVILAQSMGGLVARYALVDIEEDPNLTHDTELFISHDSPHLGANTPISLQHFNRHVKKLYQRLPVLYVGAEVIIPAAFSYANIYVDGFNNRFGTDLSLGQYVSPSEYLGVSDFPASRQMLYQWVAPDFSINNSVHEAWQLELSTTGYPQGDDTNSTIRNISVANGSECGNDQPGSTYILKIDKDAADKTIANAIIGFTDIGVAVGLALGGKFA
jgi:hypothetical protein